MYATVCWCTYTPGPNQARTNPPHQERWKTTRSPRQCREQQRQSCSFCSNQTTTYTEKTTKLQLLCDPNDDIYRKNDEVAASVWPKRQHIEKKRQSCSFCLSRRPARHTFDFSSICLLSSACSACSCSSCSCLVASLSRTSLSCASFSRLDPSTICGKKLIINIRAEARFASIVVSHNIRTVARFASIVV